MQIEFKIETTEDFEHPTQIMNVLKKAIRDIEEMKLYSWDKHNQIQGVVVYGRNGRNTLSYTLKRW